MTNTPSLETTGNSSQPERPLLFLKVGIICAEPLGFYDLLAETYEANLLGADDLRLAMSSGNRLDRSPAMQTLVTSEMKRRATDSLNDNRNVIYNEPANTKERRQRLCALAEDCGGLAVILVMRAPMNVIKDRIKSRYETNQLNIPSSLTSVKATRILAGQLFATTQFPENDERPINLNGKQGAAQLVEKVQSGVLWLRALQK